MVDLFCVCEFGIGYDERRLIWYIFDLLSLCMIELGSY